MTGLILHHAPDNASLCIRLALEAAGAPYEAQLVDRRSSAQKNPRYLAMNPNGLIPVLETPDGVLFETAAILLWLSEQHPILLPFEETTRASALKWLFWIANTLHPTLRMLFYPAQYIAAEHSEVLAITTRKRLNTQLEILDNAVQDAPWIGGDQPTILDCYLCPMLRWIQLYPLDAPERPKLSYYLNLHHIAVRNETHESTSKAQIAEGLGDAPFSAPSYADPPEGSAL
jgi:glutathione S-transferase